VGLCSEAHGSVGAIQWPGMEIPAWWLSVCRNVVFASRGDSPFVDVPGFWEAPDEQIRGTNVVNGSLLSLQDYLDKRQVRLTRWIAEEVPAANGLRFALLQGNSAKDCWPTIGTLEKSALTLVGLGADGRLPAVESSKPRLGRRRILAPWARFQLEEVSSLAFQAPNRHVGGMQEGLGPLS